MGWADAQTRAIGRYWPDIDRLLSALPQRLFRQAKLLQYDLALRYSETGQFSDIFQGAGQFPILSIATWLFDDLGFPDSPDRERVEPRLMLASVLLAARVHTIDSLSDPASFADEEQVALVQFLAERAVTELARTLPSDSWFWERRDAISLDGLEQSLEARDRLRGLVTADEPDAHLRGRWSAPARVLATAATTLAGRDEVAGPSAEMLDQLAVAFQIRDDLASLNRDLLRGLPTYPISVIARSAGIPLRPWPEPIVVLGALVATDSLECILQTALGRVHGSHRAATDLRLPTFAAYLGDVESQFEDRLRRVSGAASRSAAVSGRPVPAAPLVALAEPTMPKAIAMAAGFLLADLTFKESWESHREGMFGSDEVASRFPAGLILEILCSHGHDLVQEVDDLLTFTAENRFRYYDHRSSGIDSDTVGVFLRLRRYATKGDEGASELATVLGCLEREISVNGSVPVWITGCDDSEPPPPVIALGEGCGTVAAHLLLGLCSFPGDRYRDAIEIGASDLVDRIRDVRLGANVNYPPLYALSAFGRLLDRLEGRIISSDLASRVGEARGVLHDELERARQLRPFTAQAGALLTIACLDVGRADFIDPRWTTIVLKQQRFDGSWSAEPFAAAPNRGRFVTWYSSTTLTSALCYDALVRSARTNPHPSGHQAHPDA